MTDLATQLSASVDAQDTVLELLRAGEQILVHGNALYNNVNDRDALGATVDAVTKANEALAAFLLFVAVPHD
jgi:hypothetical protein